MNGEDDTMRDADDDALMRAARRLPQAVTPGRDLWPGIAAAIRAEAAAPARHAAPGWQRWLAYAAAVVLLVGGSSGVTWLMVKPSGPQYIVQEQNGPLPVQPVSGSFGGRYELGPEFMAARQDLVTELDAKLARLSPQARAEVEKNIAEIHTAIHQINRVLADEPDNALLQELLLAAYREELRTMRRVDGLISTVMRREDI